MKTSLFSLSLVAVGSLVFALGSASADNLYFRPATPSVDNPDGIPEKNDTYDWDTSTASWFDSSTGGTEEVWNNDTSGVAYITGQNAPYTIQLAEDITVAGIKHYGTGPGSVSTPPIITSKTIGTPSTLTFENGSTLSFQGNRSVQFQNINIDGSFTVTSGYLSLGDGVNLTNGTQIISDSSNGIYLTGETNADIVMQKGGISLNGNASVSRLSGTANIGRTTPGSGKTLTLNQNDHTVLVGHFNGTSLSFTKDGSGTFIFGDGTDHTFSSKLTITGGAFYTSGSISPSSFTVANNATAGGTFTSYRSLTLEGSGSRITPGLATLDGSNNVVNHVGTLTLAAGLSAATGGTFDFYLDESVSDLISLIQVTGGTVSLDGEIMVNLYGLDAEELQENVAYTLFDASAADSFTSTATWRLGDNTTGLEIYSYGFNESTKQFQVTFGAIPEPSSILLLLGGGFLVLLVCRQRLRS